MIEKIKELTKDTAIYGISTIVGRSLGFLLVPFYTNVFPTGEFGIQANIYAYIAFINIIFIYGMDAAYMKFASTAEPGEKKKVFSTAYYLLTLTTIVLGLLLYFLRVPLSLLMEIPDKYLKFIYYLILIVALDTIAIVPFAKLRLERRAVYYTVIKFINIIINLVLNFYLILKLKMGIEAIFISNLVASLFSFIALQPETFKSLSLVFDKKIMKKIIVFGIPYLPGALAATIVNVIDRPVVLRMTNAGTLGIYNANYKLGIFMMLFVMMFQYAWQPFFLNNAKEKNAKEIFAKVLTLFLIITSLIWIILTLFIDNFAHIQFWHGKTIIGKEYLSGLPIVPIILLGYLFNGIYYNFQAGIYIEEKTKYFPIVTGAGALANVIVNILLIPIMGIIGAALATLASYMIMAAGLYYYSQKYYPIKYEFGKVFRILSLIFITGIIYYYLYYSAGINIINKFILLFAFVGSLFALRVIEKNEFTRLIKLLFRVK
jgi:O-antigen/teichoic acid export membrane protein